MKTGVFSLGACFYFFHVLYVNLVYNKAVKKNEKKDVTKECFPLKRKRILLMNTLN